MIIIGDVVGGDGGADLCGVICVVALGDRLELVGEGVVDDVYCELSAYDEGDRGGDVGETVHKVAYAVNGADDEIGWLVIVWPGRPGERASGLAPSGEWSRPRRGAYGRIRGVTMGYWASCCRLRAGFG